MFSTSLSLSAYTEVPYIFLTIQLRFRPPLRSIVTPLDQQFAQDMYKKLEIYKTFIYSYILILFSVCVLFCIFNSFQRLFLFCVCSASFLNLNYSEFVFIFCCPDRSNRVACGYVYAWIVAGNICYSYGIGGGDKPKKKTSGLDSF